MRTRSAYWMLASAAGALGVVLRTAGGAPVQTVAHGYSSMADTVFPPAVIALGEKIFTGKAAGGLCFSCHGLNAKGTKGIAPSLVDDKWLHGDGSYLSIVAVIEAGVPKPKESPAPMPPKGGAVLNAEQVHAVAAYVYSLRASK